MSYNKLVYILTIYLDKLELGLDIYVYVYVCMYSLPFG